MMQVVVGRRRLAQHQAADPQLQRPPDHIRLMAAEHHGLGGGEQQILPALGQGDGHLAADGVGVLSGIVEHLALQHGEHVEQRHLLQVAVEHQVHVVAGHVLPGEHAIQRAVLVGHRQGGAFGVAGEQLPGPAQGDGGAEHRGLVEVQVPHLGIHVVDALGGLEAEAVQHDLGLVGHMPQAGGLIFPVAAGVAQRRVGHGRHNGIRIRIPMPRHINRIQCSSSLIPLPLPPPGCGRRGT